MSIRKVAVVATLAVAVAGAYAPATAAPKKKAPITKTYTMQLLPVPDPPQGTPSCARAELEGVSIHSETITPTGAGTLVAEVSGFAGDWDITLFDGDGENLTVGDGTSTGGGAPSTDGVDTMTYKIKKGETLRIAMCNFAGTPNATGKFTFTYK